MKGKWIKPNDYNTKNSIFYCTNRILASIDNNLFVNTYMYKINLEELLNTTF